MKYHFVYRRISGETILEVDTDSHPPEPGDLIGLRGSLESQRLKRYMVDGVFISAKDRSSNTIFIEVEPVRRKKVAGKV